MNKEAFDTPVGWRTKEIAESPLVFSLSALWENLRTVYQNELTQLAFVAIPEEKDVSQSFDKIISCLYNHI